ncbi:hypothetical protein HAX54_044462 [Datura stramonium]|uniref:Uncharacterized protein n=1 Tax=Datura stramonium TaxID=4076 RepID=A0ABS8WEL9_DATST|nr:hypothetical protein [Datura stramonium]
MSMWLHQSAMKQFQPQKASTDRVGVQVVFMKDSHAPHTNHLVGSCDPQAGKQWMWFHSDGVDFLWADGHFLTPHYHRWEARHCVYSASMLKDALPCLIRGFKLPYQLREVRSHGYGE